jgi:hypothetical protein
MWLIIKYKECFKVFDAVDKECFYRLMFFNNGMHEKCFKAFENGHHSHNINSKFNLIFNTVILSNAMYDPM